MTSLRSAVYVAPPIPFLNPSKPGKPAGVWSPISCTLIYTATSAVLVDTPITIEQTTALINWIKRIAPNRRLTYIYITHGHGDHWLGLPLLLQHFPSAKPLATPGTIAYMKSSIAGSGFDDYWEARFPGQIARPFVLAEPVPAGGEFVLEPGRHALRAVEVGHSDTHDTTVLWVPELRLAVCGDVVYGQVHQMLLEANTRAKREEWIRAVEKIEALAPAYVVPGHRQAEEMDGVWHLEATKAYIRDFGRVLEGDPKTPREVFAAMEKLYPDRFNSSALIASSIGVFNVPREHRI
ncbi:beta-lactamase-like protein [Macrophomina phaseolina]|uniref:Beta-lactamase-like protein n=1 Tax=Macrophomina phaseolina TaxID=35725 RepID=A0ABQ8GDU4_9PEZI|nr:beta-lactamase-like protein [Macrophomina phaseolina]